MGVATTVREPSQPQSEVCYIRSLGSFNISLSINEYAYNGNMDILYKNKSYFLDINNFESILI